MNINERIPTPINKGIKMKTLKKSNFFAIKITIKTLMIKL